MVEHSVSGERKCNHRPSRWLSELRSLWPSSWAESHSQNPLGRREMIPASRPLTSTHVHGHIHLPNTNTKWISKPKKRKKLLSAGISQNASFSSFLPVKLGLPLVQDRILQSSVITDKTKVTVCPWTQVIHFCRFLIFRQLRSKNICKCILTECAHTLVLCKHIP